MTACGTGTGNGKMQTGSAPATRQPTSFITGTWAFAQGCFIGTYAHPERQYATCHWTTHTDDDGEYRITGTAAVSYTMVCKATSKPTCQSSTCTSSSHVLKAGSPKCATDPCVTDEIACCAARPTCQSSTCTSGSHVLKSGSPKCATDPCVTDETACCEAASSVGHAAGYSTIEAISGSVGSKLACGSVGSWESIKSETA